MIKQQENLEYEYAKFNLIPRLKNEFKACDFKFTVDEDFAYTLLAQMAVHRRANLATLIGLVAPTVASVDEALKQLYRAAEEDLVDYCPESNMFIVKYPIADWLLLELDQYQFPMPLIVEPKDVSNNRDTGYFTKIGSILLKDNHHDLDVCLDHINRANRIPLSINWEMLGHVRDNPAMFKDNDYSNYQQQLNHIKFKKVGLKVLEKLNNYSDLLYLTHKYDKRGRSYCMGYHFSYQSTDVVKSFTQFANKEITNG